MSLSPDALRAIRAVAQNLGDLRDQVVFVGGVVRGLLITDPAVEGSGMGDSRGWPDDSQNDGRSNPPSIAVHDGELRLKQDEQLTHVRQ